MSEAEDKSAGALEGELQPDTAGTGIAIALDEARTDPSLRGEIAEFLKDQRRLMEAQMAHLGEQFKHIRLRTFEQQITVALKMLVVAVGAAIVIGLGAMVWNASRDHGLVVEAFSVPPDLAARGLTGQVVATRLLDKLTAMQAATDSGRPSDSYKNNWGDDLKVEIPTTGVSFDQLQRFLNAWLGHETHISGEVVRIPAGLSVTARAGNTSAQAFEGAEADFDNLIQKSAEAIYEQTQPYRYAQFLVTGEFDFHPDSRPNDAKTLAITEKLVASPDRLERAWGFIGLSGIDSAEGNLARAVRDNQMADAVDPTILGQSNIGQYESLLGHDEAVLAAKRKSANQTWHLTATASAIQAVMDPGYVAFLQGDLSQAARRFTAAAAMPSYAGQAELAPALEAESLALAHDTTRALALLADTAWKSDADIAPRILYSQVVATPFYAIAAARGDWTGAIADLLALQSTDSFRVPLGRQAWLVFGQPRLAYTRAMSGDIAGGEALVASTPPDCYLCVRMRGKIAAVKKDWAGAEKWFAEAVKQGPSLPLAYVDWGEMQLAKGDADGAIAKFQIANQKGPRFADPLEVWGEALMAKGDFAGAATKFEQANKFAPKWGRLHLKWGEALAKAGHADDAKKQFALAAALDLSAADKAELAVQGAPHG